MEAIYEFDYAILNFIQEHLVTPFGDAFFSLITHLADGGWFWIAAAAVFLCFKKTRKMGICMGIALVGGLLIGNVTLKPLIARIRPYDNPDYSPLKTVAELLIEAPHDFSFPSGHTLASFEGAGAIFFCNKKWGSAALVLAVLIAFSRLYLYVHYPTDIIAGIAIALGLAYGAYKLVGFIEKKIAEKMAQKKETAE